MLKSIGHVTLATISYSLLQWLVLIAFARLGSLEQLGEYALLLAITAPVFMFTNMRLRFVVATDTNSERNFRVYFQSRLFTSLIAFFCILAIGLMFGLSTDLLLSALVLSVAKCFESYSDVVYGLYQRENLLGRMSTSMVVSGVGMLIAALIGISVFDSVLCVAVGMVAARVVVFLLIELPLCKEYWIEPGSAQQDAVSMPNEFRKLAVRCWPLGTVALLASLNVNIPRYFIEAWAGLSDLGVFAALAYVPIAGYLVVGTIGQIMMPTLSRALKSEQFELLRRQSLLLLSFGLLAGVVAVLFGLIFGRIFLLWVYGVQFAEYRDLFVLLLISGGLSYVVVNAIYVLTVAGHYAKQIAIYAVDAAVVTLLCIFAIPEYGLTGAAAAMITSQLCQVLVAGAIVWIVLRNLNRQFQ